MRLWHLVFAVAIVSVVMTLARDDAGRVGVIVFTVGALGQARGLIAHATAIAATTLVLAAASTVMLAWLFVGAWLVNISIG